MPKEPVVEKKSKPRLNIDVLKEELKDISLGDSISISASGTVVGLSDSYQDKSKASLSIELRNVSILSGGKGSRKDSKTPMEEAYDESQSKEGSKESSKAGKEKEE